MNAATWRVRLFEPTLQRRSVTHLLLAFVLVWVALLAYMYVQRERANAAEPPTRKFAAAVGGSLAQFSDARDAVAAVRATEHWLNVRRRQIGVLPGSIMFDLRDASGNLLYASPGLRGAELPAQHLPVRILLGGVPHHYQQGVYGRWQLRTVETVRTGGDFLAYNSTFILPYLLLALPIVLVPLWLSVRSGLRPLQHFARGIAARQPDDLRPIGLQPRHRELKPLSDALEHLLQRLRQRLEREREFVQDAAHEIRTPLAVVSTQAHVMAHAHSDAERRGAYALLNLAIARASHLAQQLLLLATLDDPQQRPMREVDAAQATRELLGQLAPQALACGVELSLEAPDRWTGMLDEAAFSSIVTNLVDNAIRYGAPGGNVVVTLRGDEERMTLQVQDDGPGIAAAERHLVFERFYRCGGEEAQGTGLGLAIVRQAALRMGGHAMLTAGLGGRGVGVLVSLPVPGFVAR